MIKKGDTVKVYEDPITCENLEFAGTVIKVLNQEAHGVIWCKVKDERGDKFDRWINVKNH